MPDPSDARARLIRIAERGRQAIPLAAEVVSEVEAEWTEHLGKRRMGYLEILVKLREITDPRQSAARLTRDGEVPTAVQPQERPPVAYGGASAGSFVAPAVAAAGRASRVAPVPGNRCPR